MEKSYDDAIDKILSNENIFIVENEKVLFDNDDIVKTLNSFFFNIIKVLGFSQTDYIYFVDEIKDLVLRAIMKNYILYT